MSRQRSVGVCCNDDTGDFHGGALSTMVGGGGAYAGYLAMHAGDT